MGWLMIEGLKTGESGFDVEAVKAYAEEIQDASPNAAAAVIDLLDAEIANIPRALGGEKEGFERLMQMAESKLAFMPGEVVSIVNDQIDRERMINTFGSKFDMMARYQGGSARAELSELIKGRYL